MNKFGQTLNELRLEMNISRRELARRLNVSERLIAYWESGQRECNFDTLIAIADIFSTSVDYLLGRTD